MPSTITKNKRLRAFLITGAVASVAVAAGAQTTVTKSPVKQTASMAVVNPAMPARNAATHDDDLRITNQCVEAGETKEACLCVTHILKYEMSIGEYAKTAAQFAPSQPEGTGPAVIEASIETDPVSDLQRRQMVTAFRTITTSSDFAQRCGVASRYFERAVAG